MEELKERENKLYEVKLVLKGVSAMISTLITAIREGDAKPTDEMIADALYSIEVQLDQVVSDVEHHDEEELLRLYAIAKHTGIPMSQLYEMI